MKNYSKLLVSVLMLVSVFVIPIYASEGGKTEMSQMESNSSLSILEDICAQKELYRVLDYEGQDITDALYGVITDRIGSYSEPVLKFLTQDMGNDVTNLKIVDRVRSTQVSSNGIDLQVDYYFDLYGDYYDEVEVITKPNTYLNRHGFSTKCNGESLDTIVMEPLIPEDEKEN